MVCKSQIMYGIEVWGLSEAWREVDKVHSRFCKELIGIPNCATTRSKEKGRCPLCLGEEDAKHILLDCCENINWRLKFLMICG